MSCLGAHQISHVFTSPAPSTSLAFSRGTWTWSSRARSIGVACLAQVERQGGSWFDWATVGARCAVCGYPQISPDACWIQYITIILCFLICISRCISWYYEYPQLSPLMSLHAVFILGHFCAHCCNSLYILQLCSDQSHAMFKLWSWVMSSRFYCQKGHCWKGSS